MTDPSHWLRRFTAYSRDKHRQHFTKHHTMFKSKRGLVFTTALPFGGGCLYRHMFAVLTDGTVLGPRGKQVDEAVLVAWFEDARGLTDIC